MKQSDTLSSLLGQFIFGGRVTEFCVNNPGYATGLGCLVFSMLVVSCIKRSNGRRYGN